MVSSDKLPSQIKAPLYCKHIITQLYIFFSSTYTVGISFDDCMDGFDGGIGNAPLVYLIIAIINTKCKLIHIQNLLLPHLQYVMTLFIL